MTKNSPPKGRFVWHDLMTPDVDDSIHFYVKMFGWKIVEEDRGAELGPYKMIEADGRNIGGFLPTAQDATAYWAGYVTVDDVDRTAKEVVRQAGSLPQPPRDLARYGRYCMAGDPANAYFCPFSYAGEEPEESREAPLPGHFCWDELLVPENMLEKCRDFYRQVIGWSTRDVDMGPAGTYVLFDRSNGRETGGMMKLPEDAGDRGFWIPYIAVADVDASAEKAQDHGASQISEPRDIPDVGRYSTLRDPHGAMFAVFKGASK